MNIKNIFLLTVVLVISLLGCNLTEPNRICFKDGCFRVELATTAQERSEGLMFRESLEKDKGMLFIFEEEQRYAFWMKNTYIPLDIIWMNKDKQVVFIKKNAQPCERQACGNYAPGKEALYVLEVNAGSVGSAGINIGDMASF